MTSNPRDELPEKTGIPQTPPQRVVSLVPSITESLFDLALGDRIVGITDYCIHPADQLAQMTRVGGTKNPQIDDIIALQPDLVMMNREENRLQDAEALINAGINVWASHPCTVQESLNLLWQIMEVFEQTSMVERVQWIERQLDWTLAAIRDQSRPTVFVPIWYQPWITVASRTYVHDVLTVCGGTNVFATHPDQSADYPRPSLEDIIASQPDVVLLPDEPFAFGDIHIAELSDLDIPAARNQRIHLVDGTLLTWHGTRVARALAAIPPLLSCLSEPDERE